jgi:Chromo (CHRromatin Organisation MOdifier) domain
MRKYIEERIRKCDACNRNKASRHKPYGEMQPPKAPENAWKSIALDFIVKLPPSRERITGTVFDTVLVVTDRLTKYAHFIPYKESASAEDLAYTFTKYIIGNHGIPEEIISDRDKLFTSKFWKSLTDQLGIHQKLSTAYHPQTDGQTERLNQTLEQYLRFYINYQQNNWTELLPVAQLAYNSTATSITGISPFYANFGYNPTSTLEPRHLERLAERATVTVNRLKNLHQELSRDVEFLAQRSAMHYNSKRLRSPRLREGDKVYLLRRNIKTTRPSDKLDHKKFGPFKIKRNIKDVSFELCLPPTMKIHPVFHISLLEPAHPDTPEGPTPEVDPETQEEEHEVEKVLDVRINRRKLQWLVKWTGYGNEHNTWEPKENLTNCRMALVSFYRKNQTKPGKAQWGL